MKLILLFLFNLSAYAHYADVNGIKLYYELHGKKEGVPLILLNGGGSNINVTYGRILPFLSKKNRLIALDEAGHGKSSDHDGPRTFEGSADDVIALIKHLKLKQVDVMGFSNGATIGLYVAIKEPTLVRKLIFASSITKLSGAHSWFWDYMKKADFSNMPKPLKDEFLKDTPDPAKLKVMHDKDAERMKNFKETDDALVKSVKAKTLIVSGDQELVKLEHVIELSKLIEGSKVMILPGGHGEYLGEMIMGKPGSKYPELTAGLLEEFLKAE